MQQDKRHQVNLRKAVEKKSENTYRELGGFSIAQSVFGRTALEKYEKPSSARVIKSPAQCQGLFQQKWMVAGLRRLSAK